MAPKKKPTRVKVGKNLSDENAEVLINCEYTIPTVKQILKDKPHLTSSKFENVPAAMDEVKELSPKLIEVLLHFETEKADKEKPAQVLCALCDFIKLVLQFEDFFELPQIRRVVFHLMHMLEREIPAKAKTCISFLCERYIEVTIIDEHQVVSQCLLNYLLDLTLSVEHVKKIDIKRVWSLRNFIEQMNLENIEWRMIAKKYLLTVTNSNYLAHREGQQVIGYVMKKNFTLAKKVHDTIMNHVPTLSKSLAAGYGQSYFVAWTYAEEDVQKTIEHFISQIIDKVLNIPRAGIEMPKAGANGFAILSTLHSLRKMRNFSQTLSELYSPVIWRFLRDSDPWKRCNAAQVFFDVFPLENPFASGADNANYLERQINEMKDLLMDDSHFVRIISIRGICSNLAHSLELFNVAHVKHILEILALELTHDGSSFLVRKAVFEGFEFMLCEPPGSTNEAPPGVSLVLQNVISSLHRSFYDSNEKVRKAFAKMLLKLKEKAQFLTEPYWSIVSIEDVIMKLATEGPVVGELLSSLCIDQMIGFQTIDMVITRLCKMLDLSFEGAKNAFKYSHKALTVHMAYRTIITLMGAVRKSLKDHLESLEDDSISSEPKSAKMNTTRKNIARVLGPSNSIPEEESGNESTLETSLDKSRKKSGHNTTASSVASRKSEKRPKNDLFSKHRYIRGLIQISTVIWVVFRKELSEEEEYLRNLYTLACAAVPMFLKYYKGTPVYYATVSFASLIPIAKLRPVSTISSACISELKEITEQTDTSKVECLIYSLCSWSRGHDVLDLASEWLNFAFREQNLNNTAMAKTGNQKVRFLQNTGKPMLALKLLDILFSDVINEQRILNKNYEQLYEFYTCLERILVIVERKLAGDDRFDKPGTTLTDEFIARAFHRYVCLMHVLHRPNKSESDKDEIPPFDAAASLMKTICWATEILCPKIPLQEQPDAHPPLAVRCCLTVLDQCALAVTLGETNEEHCRTLCFFTKDLLSLECSWFLEATFNVISAVAEHAQAFTSNDEWNLLKQVLPCLYEKGLSVITNSDVNSETIKSVIKNVTKFKAALFSLPKIYYETHGDKSPEFKDAYKNLIQTCILLVLQEINYEETAVTHSKLEDLPCFATIILKVVIFKTYLMKLLIPSLINFMETYGKNQDEVSLLSCVSILYTVIVAAKKRFTLPDLENALSCAYRILSQFQPKEKPPKEDSFSDVSVQIDVKKAGLPVILELGNFLSCAVFKPMGPLATSSPTGSLQALNIPEELDLDDIEEDEENDQLERPSPADFVEKDAQSVGGISILDMAIKETSFPLQTSLCEQLSLSKNSSKLLNSSKSQNSPEFQNSYHSSQELTPSKKVSKKTQKSAKNTFESQSPHSQDSSPHEISKELDKSKNSSEKVSQSPDSSPRSQETSKKSVKSQKSSKKAAQSSGPPQSQESSSMSSESSPLSQEISQESSLLSSESSPLSQETFEKSVKPQESSKKSTKSQKSSKKTSQSQQSLESSQHEESPISSPHSTQSRTLSRSKKKKPKKNQ